MAADYKDIAVTAYDTLRFSWWEKENGQSIADNTTIVCWGLYLISGTYGRISSNATRDWYVKINGEEYSGNGSISIGNNETKTLAYGETPIEHNADGTKTFSYEFSQDFQITFSSKWVGLKSGSGTGTLTAIPRAANIINITTTIDDETDSITFTYSNPAGSAVDSISFGIGDRDWRLITPYELLPIAGGSYTYNLDDARKKLLRQAANKVEFPITFYFKTIIGGKDYWSNVFATLNILDAEPQLNPSVIDVGSVSTTLTGNASGRLIKGFNSIEYLFNATPQKEASIVAYNLTCGGVKINKDSSNKAYNVESGDFVFSVTDSRGITVSKTINFDVVPYVKPTINQSVEMALVGETGAKASIGVKGNYYKGSFGAVNNTLTLQYRKKEDGGSYGNWVTVSASPTFGTNTYSVNFDVTGLSYDKTYTFQCSAVDATGTTHKVESTEYTISLVPVFDWGKDDFAFNVPVSIMGDTIADFPIEEGNSGGWRYTKWKSGRVELYGKVNHTTAIAEQKGNLYRTNALTASLPFTVYNCAYWVSSATDGNVWASPISHDTNTSTIRYVLWCAWSNASATHIVECRVLGTWK